MQRAVARGRARRESEPLHVIGVDKTSFQKRHEYVTVVYDVERRRVAEALDGRSQEALLKNPESMKPRQRLRFDALRETSLRVARAWAMKESARHLWSYCQARPGDQGMDAAAGLDGALPSCVVCCGHARHCVPQLRCSPGRRQSRCSTGRSVPSTVARPGTAGTTRRSLPATMSAPRASTTTLLRALAPMRGWSGSAEPCPSLAVLGGPERRATANAIADTYRPQERAPTSQALTLVAERRVSEFHA